MGYGDEDTMAPEEQDMGAESFGDDNSGRISEIGRDLARLAKNIADSSIRAQLETYSEELGMLSGEEAEEPEGEEMALDGEAPSRPKPAGGKSASDRLAVAQLRKAVKL